MKNIFVYGSLKRDHWNHRTLQGSKFLGNVTTKGKYYLTDCGFPYLIPEEALRDAGRGATAPVAGEMYQVTSEEVMDSLDALEGVGYGHYKHHTLEVVDQEGNTYEVTAYVPCDAGQAARLPACRMEEGVYVWG